MNRKSIMVIALLVGACIIGFKGDAQKLTDTDDMAKAKKGDKIERFCPVQPTDEEMAAMESDFESRKAELRAVGEAEVTGRRPDLADAFADYGRIAVGWQLDCPLPRTPGLLEAEFLDGTGPRGTRTLHPRVAVAAAR